MTDYPGTPDHDPSGPYAYPGGQPRYATRPSGDAPAYDQAPQGREPDKAGAGTSGPQGLSLASMILGLASLVFIGGLMCPQIIGLVLGISGLHKESPQGRGFALTGIITNSLALLIYAALWAFGLYFFAALMGNTESEFTSYM